MRQVITIRQDGTMAGLQRKRSQGLDLRQFGHARITRASEIVWNDETQRWTIHLLSGAFKGYYVTWGMWQADVGTHWKESGGTPLDTVDGPEELAQRLGFDEYEDAVAAEIAYLDALRLMGRL